MPTWNISLPEAMTEFLEAQAARGGYATVSEYLRAVVVDLQKREAKRELEDKLREALLSGPAGPMTREDWDGLDRRVWERHQEDRPLS